MNHDVKEVLQEIENARSGGQRISSDRVSIWMNSSSLELNALAFAVLFDQPDLVETPSPLEVKDFFRRHLLQAMKENRPTANIPSRYLAADALRSWFQRLWANDRADPTLIHLREDFAALVQCSDTGLRDAVLTGILEHLFVSDDIRRFFSPWSITPGLAEPYEEAIRLAK
jgi:hypothetical protein